MTPGEESIRLGNMTTRIIGSTTYFIGSYFEKSVGFSLATKNKRDNISDVAFTIDG